MYSWESQNSESKSKTKRHSFKSNIGGEESNQLIHLENLFFQHPQFPKLKTQVVNLKVTI